MQTSSSIYKTAISLGSFKSETDFQNSLVAYYLTQFKLLYSGQISNVTLISANTSGNTASLQFRITFINTQSTTTTAQRTAIASNIQSTFNQVISKYFGSISQSMNLKANVSLTPPNNVSTTVKKAIVTVVGNNQSQSVTNTGSSSSITVAKTSTASKSII